jgi:hypothetical protein
MFALLVHFTKNVKRITLLIITKFEKCFSKEVLQFCTLVFVCVRVCVYIYLFLYMIDLLASVAGWLSCLRLNLRSEGSNPVDDDGFLREIKIHSIASFGGEVKLLSLCHKILRHVNEICRL